MLFKRWRVWKPRADYTLGSVVYYPDKRSPSYMCVRPHRSRIGMDPPKRPELWLLIEDTPVTDK